MKVFISATSTDLWDCRSVARDVLLTGDIQPVDEEHFPPDHRALDEYLESTVGQCDALVCLVGHVFGAAPENSDGEPRSYTQLEYDYARTHDKPVFVFMASDRMQPTVGWLGSQRSPQPRVAERRTKLGARRASTPGTRRRTTRNPRGASAASTCSSPDRTSDSMPTI